MTKTEFRIALLTLGVSEKEFAEEIDKHPQTVSRWATGGLDVPTLVAKYVELRVNRLASLSAERLRCEKLVDAWNPACCRWNNVSMDSPDIKRIILYHIHNGN